MVFWPSVAGAVFLAAGIFSVRKELAAAPGLDKLIGLGGVFMAAPLAVFGAEHLAGPRIIMEIVPRWMPWRLFWTYFVGVALIAAALSFLLRKRVRLAATLLGIMFFLFVLMIDVPGVTASPGNRIEWTLALRELAFAGGAWSLAAIAGPRWLREFSRLAIAVTAVFYGVEHLFHPAFVPGVPLGKLLPVWIPIRLAWAYLTGTALVAGGVTILIGHQTRTAAACLGALITLLVLVIYVPILAAARRPSEFTEGLNYVFDTLLFAGTLLVLARASATPKTRSAHV